VQPGFVRTGGGVSCVISCAHYRYNSYFKQLIISKTKNLGYDRENMIYIPLEGDLTAKYKVFKDEP